MVRILCLLAIFVGVAIFFGVSLVRRAQRPPRYVPVRVEAQRPQGETSQSLSVGEPAR